MDETYNMQNPEQPAGPQKTPGTAIASMILGIVSLVLCCWWYVGIPCAIVAIVLGIITMRKGPVGKGMCLAGIICGGVAIVLCIVMLLFAAAIIAATPELQGILDSYS